MAKLQYKTGFNDSWLDFKTWIKKFPDDNYKFYCQWCRFTGCLSTTGKKALVKHLNTKKHQMADKKSCKFNYTKLL